MRFVIFDLEVYKYDFLLGIKLLDENLELIEYIQVVNDFDLMADTVYNLKDDIWVGWNIEYYDNPVLTTAMKARDTKEMIELAYMASCKIIDKNEKIYNKFPFVFLDVMQEVGLMNGLKIAGANSGWDIEELPFDPHLDRPLTQDELELLLSYNRHDLDLTHDQFKKSFSNCYQVKRDLIDYFNLPLATICKPLATVTAMGLGAKPGKWPDRRIGKVLEGKGIRVDNPEVRDYYMSEKYLKEEIKFKLCGLEHRGGLGGLHGADTCVQAKRVWDLDVKGYYSLIMMEYGLLSRAIDPTGTMGRESSYGKLYYERLRLKKIDPKLALALKTALLTVFGATQNKYQLLYDNTSGQLIMIVGQMGIIDLLEKLEPYIRLYQTNTDGIIFEPLDEEKVIEIYKDWEKRTGFELELTILTNFVQKDVNNYIAWNETDGHRHIKGQLVVNYERERDEYPYYISLNNRCVVAKAIVDYFLEDIPPEVTIMNAKGKDPRSFMYLLKKGAFQACHLYKDGQFVQDMGKINRVFASVLPGTTTIYRMKNGRPNKYNSTPENMFVFNKHLDEDWKEEMWEWIDYDWYIMDAYKWIRDYIDKDKGWEKMLKEQAKLEKAKAKLEADKIYFVNGFDIDDLIELGNFHDTGEYLNIEINNSDLYINKETREVYSIKQNEEGQYIRQTSEKTKTAIRKINKGLIPLITKEKEVI